MERFLAGRRFHYGACLLVAVVTVAAYSTTFTAPFHFDDIPNIVENYTIRSLANLPELLLGSRGVTMATFALNYAAGGLNETGYHLVNTAIHLINGVMVYFLVFLTLSTIQPREKGGDEFWAGRIAVYASLLFAVHPIQTQAVTYVVQRMEILASLFYLLALLLFIRGVAASKASKRALLFGGVVLSYILGFASKEIAVTLPAVILLYDLIFITRGRAKGLLQRWPLYTALAVLLLYFTATTLVPMGGFGDVSAASAGFGVKGITPLEYLLTQCNVLVYYLLLLIVPVNQNIDYDFPLSRGFFEMPPVQEGTILNIPLPPPVLSLMLLLIIGGCALYLFFRYRGHGGGRGPVVSFFIFWFFILLSPTSSIVPIVDVIFEHRLYLASAGFFAVFAIGFDALFSKCGKGTVAGRGAGETP